MTIFETESDIQRERSVAVAIERRFKCKCLKMPPLSFVDFAAVRGSFVVAWIEVKVRDCNFGEYPSVFLSEDKIERGLTMSTYLCHYVDNRTLPFIFVVRFNDGDYFAKIEGIDPEWQKTTIQAKDTEGRTRAPDVVVGLPLTIFKKLEAK